MSQLRRAFFTVCFLLASLGPAVAAAGPSIAYFPGRQIWVLNTQRASYALGVNAKHQLQAIYWGARLWSSGDFPSAVPGREHSSFDTSETRTSFEYSGWGGPYYNVPALKAAFADGDRDLELNYVSYRIQGDTLEIELKDAKFDLTVTLEYRVFPEEDIIRKQAIITNRTRQTITLASAQSGCWYVPQSEHYRLSYLTGRWAGETQLTREPVDPGIKVLDSRRGNTSGQLNPWFALDAGDATESSGRVWFGALAWSGNWKLAVEETTSGHQVRITGGFNDFDFSWPLAPGESLRTPAFYGGFSDAGFGRASRLMHRLELRQILPDHVHPRLRPVLYNSWEATEFNVNQANQDALADKAASLGAELFVVDDGWFGERNNDHAGLGDWFVNRQKFPQGLAPLIAYVHKLGMKFGLWFEPEMVNPDSQLYRAHPDWVLNFPGRPRTAERNQLVLNMARTEVKDYVLQALDRMLSKYDIQYIKWDMNRHFSEPGWPQAPPAEQQEVWVRYTRNVYAIMRELRARHPGLEIESCSGGGGRIDLGVLRYADEVWTSDNTDAFDRLGIQEGFTYAYTPKIMSAWVTDVPSFNHRVTSLKYRFLVAMQGALGIGGNLDRWSAEDMSLARGMVAFYKRIRPVVQTGKLYRLLSPRLSNLAANEYVAEDGSQAVVFAFLHSQQRLWPVPPLYLRGLDEQALYRVEPLSKDLESRPSLKQPSGDVSGSYLMNHGLFLDLRGDYDSTALVIQRVSDAAARSGAALPSTGKHTAR